MQQPVTAVFLLPSLIVAYRNITLPNLTHSRLGDIQVRDGGGGDNIESPYGGS
jgi:hypothetical protein